MTTKPSILTSLRQEKAELNHQTMSRNSLNWLMKRIAELRNPSKLSPPITREKSRYTKSSDTRKFLMGGLYFFVYDPKGKNELPYYDKFPLVMPLKRESDGFIGLNLHYLPIKHRVVFMKKMMPLALRNDDDEIKRIKITYSILDASSKYKEFRPCIKKYLYTHVKSKILAVEPEEWDIATYLPVHQFKKEQAKNVWQDSLNEIRNS